MYRQPGEVEKDRTVNWISTHWKGFIALALTLASVFAPLAWYLIHRPPSLPEPPEPCTTEVFDMESRSTVKCEPGTRLKFRDERYVICECVNTQAGEGTDG